MPWCSWEQAFINQNMFLATLIHVRTFPVWVPGHQFICSLLINFLQICTSTWRKFYWEIKFLGRQIGGRAVRFSVSLVPLGIDKFLKSVSFWQTGIFPMENILSEHFCPLLYFLPRLSALMRKFDCWHYHRFVVLLSRQDGEVTLLSFLPVWQYLRGVTLIWFFFFFPLLIFLCHLPLHNTTRLLATARVVLYPIAMFMCFCVREERLEIMFVWSLI